MYRKPSSDESIDSKAEILEADIVVLKNVQGGRIQFRHVLPVRSIFLPSQIEFLCASIIAILVVIKRI